MSYLSSRVSKLKPSPTLALATKAKELKSQGKDVISLSVGEPDWDTFAGIKQAAHKAIDEGYTKYMPASGTPELRKVICEQTNTDLKADYTSDEVTVSTGGKYIIYSLLQSVIDSGDEVIIPAPYWVSYPTMVELAGGTPVIVSPDQNSNMKLTPKDLESALTSKTKLVMSNSPSNPTGQVYTSEELKALGDLLEKTSALIMCDDIYNRLVFEGDLAPHLLHTNPSLKDRIVIVNGVAKTYSMTGWRVGWALGPSEIIKAMTRLQSQSVSCACSISQMAAIEAVKNGAADVANSVTELRQRRDFAHARLADLPGVKLMVPGGAFYMWPDVSTHFGKSYQGRVISNSKDFAEELLAEKMVAVVPGVEFGMEGYLRLSYALSQERMGEAIDRLSDFIGLLK